MTAYRSRAILPLGFITGCLILVIAIPNAAFADQVVYLVNGKAMMVKSVEKGPKFTVLEVEGGGKVGIPNELIDRIEDYQVQPPGAVMPQVPQVPAALAPTTAPNPAPVVPPAVTGGTPGVPVAQGRLVPGVQTQGAMTAPPPTALPSGPGYGGRADTDPQGRVRGANPIALGGDPSAPGPSRPQPGPAMFTGGPGGAAGGRLINPGGPGRPGFAQRAMAGRFAGRGGAAPRRNPDMSGYQAPPQVQPPPPAQNPQPAATPPPPPPSEEQGESTPDPSPAEAPPDDAAPSGGEGSADQGSS